MSLSTGYKAELEPKTKCRVTYCLPLLAVASLACSHQLPCSLLFHLVPAVDHTGRQLDLADLAFCQIRKEVSNFCWISELNLVYHMLR